MEVNNNDVKTNSLFTEAIGKWRSIKYLNEIICFLVACISYANGLCGDFVHDDLFAIKNNDDVTGRNSIFETFRNDYWGQPMSNNGSHKSYRPLTILTFRLQFFLFGSSTVPLHVVNVILHALVTGTVTWTCLHVLHLPGSIPVMTGLLFAVHPIHVEAVTGLVGRAELLSALLFLYSFVCFNRSLNPGFAGCSTIGCILMFISGAVCSVFATLSKEQGIMVLPVYIIYDMAITSRHWLLRPHKLKNKALNCLVKRILLISLIACCLLAFRYWIMDGQLPSFQHQDNPASFSPFLVTRCLSYCYIWYHNVFLLLLPSTLCYDWQGGSIPLVESFTDLRNVEIILVFAVTVLFVYKVTCFIKNDPLNKHLDIMFIVFIFSVLPFLPASNILFRVGFVIAERTLYLPSIGYCILIATGIHVLYESLPSYSCFIRGSCVFLICVLLLKTWSQNRVWNSRESLFLSGVKSQPQNAKVHYNYANFLKDDGKIQQAIAEYEQAIRLFPDHASAHNNLGTLLTDVESAMQHFQTALKIMPDHTGALINLGARYFKSTNKTEGMKLLKRALEIEPFNVEGLITYGGMMAELNRWDEAERLFSMAITEKPDFAEAYHNYGAFLHLKGEIPRAVKYYQKAYTLDSGHIGSMVNAARGLRQLGKLEDAHLVLHRILDQGANIDAMDVLGLVYFQMGRIPESISLYEDLNRENPNNTEVATHYAQVLANGGETDKAERILLNVLKTNPDHLEALQFLANVLGQKGLHEKALLYLEKGINIHTDKDGKQALENMYFQHGNHHKDLKQYDQALQSYKKAVELQPGNIKAHVNIGAIYHLKGNFRKAREHYQIVLEHDPGHKIASQNLRKLINVEKPTNNGKH